LNASKDFKITYNGIASETYSTTAAPVQFAATDIYNNMEQLLPFIDAQRKILNGLSKIIINELRHANVNIHEPNGGFYIFPDFSNYKAKLINKGIDTAEKLCVELLSEKGVAMLPASAFGFDETHFYSRMCYVDFDGAAAISAYQNGHELNDEFYETNTPAVVGGIRALCDYLMSL